MRPGLGCRKIASKASSFGFRRLLVQEGLVALECWCSELLAGLLIRAAAVG